MMTPDPDPLQASRQYKHTASLSVLETSGRKNAEPIFFEKISSPCHF
jgi:hypothetical protein